MGDGIATSIWQGSFNLLGVEVKCHVLDDGSRIIEAESMEQLLLAMAGPDAILDNDEMAKFVFWKHGK